MSKLVLVLRPNEFSSFTSFYLTNFWSKYFDIKLYNSQDTYDKKTTLFVVWWQNLDDRYVDVLLDNNYKIIIDGLWEKPGLFSKKNCHVMENKNWFWYNESLWWQGLGYNTYVPCKQIEKLAFMPIRRPSGTRDKIVESLREVLPEFIWSYKNKHLPNDSYIENDVDQRYVNFEWYNKTQFSVVVETSQSDYLEVTEKSYKPIAFYHPFVIVGVAGVLSKIKKNGFETFENLFDESYDQIECLDQRLVAIVQNIKNANIGNYDVVTEKKLKHNHEHFFNKQLIEKRIVDEIVNPIIAYAEQY